ncbi:alcohol dehydrogenase class IV [Variovorax boronicumulans]|uniref:iron-containing alcohol dehydrogenase n=1 Tax=Variovorax boronicumulans TaxID=436515 RepID=UPI0027859FC6|nr:iron-containing alcohol dehydrogenase [Variovorax boronicumulans]MDP9908682.1 alcohol dehydrogenase class IV [Variovorax boronicumulans]
MSLDEPATHDFHARTYPLRIYSGTDALIELPRELQRAGASRALILCGRSVRERTGLTQVIETLAGGRIVGIFSGISEGAPAECLEEAAAKAREVQADALIAVGAGSVIKGVRIVAMLIGESRSLLEMATVHRDDEPPVSQRLNAPKMPIFNVLTSPTSAQNRGGSAARYRGSAHHLEFFDPKTRPRAVFWDTRALATAPAALARSTSFEVYWWALMCMGAVRTANPLVQASRRHAWELARHAYPKLGEADDAAARIDLCAAALLQNRDEEDGGRPWSCQLLARAAYACAVGVFNHYEGVTQSRGYAAFAPAMIRELGAAVPEVAHAMGEALGMELPSSGNGTETAAQVAAQVARNFQAQGWRTDLHDSGIPAADAPRLLALALRNFNANHDRLLDRHREAMLAAITRTIAP